ncbi:hypothetical protein DOTSEDRAFT_48581 [Dothistroma septosporum NZE10]|uniref:NAD(P)-binding domain-containing protein n=1 Tax=Dothistroma septosporum (strain NZE10 / CBS 128990) TaxID=675120 RepID=N1PDP0_DOTSN|nr:hypothetical protein DOTSEDRAFT_48581 [Dothistroma septosporum NZE10]
MVFSTSYWSQYCTTDPFEGKGSIECNHTRQRAKQVRPGSASTGTYLLDQQRCISRTSHICWTVRHTVDMIVLLLGATGNLGSRLVPALLAHGHSVVAYVRSPVKLRSLLPQPILDCIATEQGDAFDTASVANALRRRDCEALVNTAGTRESPWKEQTLGKLVASVITASITVGQERRKPLRSWIVGGMGSLDYPGTDHKIQDYMPAWMTEHHLGTEAVIRGVSVSDVEWSLLCVAMLYPRSDCIELHSRPQKRNLLVATSTPPAWEDHWIRSVPLVGPYLNLVPVIRSYACFLEDVAELLAEDLANDGSPYIGHLVGFKATIHTKSA